MNVQALDSLSQFTGTEQWYQHGLNRKLTFTDGVKYLADNAGAYWLVDEIAIANMLNRKVQAEEFQVWILEAKNSHGKLRCEDGNGDIVYRKSIPFTDFPLPEVRVWMSGGVMMLPSEY